MKKTFLAIATMVMMIAAQAQTIDGSVIDSQNHPLPYVTMSVLRLDSTLLTGAITNENGQYVISVNKGDYILQASFIGYTTYTQHVTVDKSLHLNAITLTEETSELQEVEVKAKRPLIERQMDKVVMNVSQSTFAVGHTGEDILRKAPGVKIDKDGNVTVNGKSVEIYIDNRPSYMSGEQLKGLLMGTDGSTIEKIEIITNPSSKYDAAGQGGIINIKLKKNKTKGLNGSISGSYDGMYWRNRQKYLQDDMVSLGLNYRGEKTYTALSLTQVYSSQLVEGNMCSEQPRTIGTQTATQKTNARSDFGVDFQYYNFRLSNDFYLNDKNTLGFILNVPVMKYGLDIVGDGNRSTTTWDQDTLQDISTKNNTLNYSPQHTANLNYTHTFSDSLSRELTANIDYNRYSNQKVENQTNTIYKNVEGSTLPQQLDINTKQIVDIYSAKLDFQTAFWQTGMLEAGAKWAMSNTFNTMNTDSTLVSQTTTHTETRYDYSEQVGAVYINAAKQFNEHWNAKLGLRGELTYAKGTFYEQNTDSSVVQKPYFNLFPTAFVGYSPTQEWSMDISYTRRIQRAGYDQLNPFVSYTDAHTYSCGNPDLKPQYSHQVDINFAYSQYVSLGFNFAHTQDMHTQKITMFDNGDIMLRWENFGTSTSHGGSLALTELPLIPKFNRDSSGEYIRNEKGRRTFDAAWLTLTVNMNAYHFINNAKDDPTYGKRKSFYSSLYACLTSYLPKDFQISLDGYWDTPYTSGYYQWSGTYGMNLAIKKQFLQKTLTLTFKVDDLLQSMNFDMTSVGLAEGYSGSMYQRVLGHRVGIGITYMFGQAQQHKHRNVGNVDESSRLGSSSSIGSGK